MPKLISNKPVVILVLQPRAQVALMTRIAKEGCATGLMWEESLEADTPTLNICRPRGDRFIANSRCDVLLFSKVFLPAQALCFYFCDVSFSC